MTLVPGLQRRCILSLEKDAADASDSLHGDLLCVVLGDTVSSKHAGMAGRVTRATDVVHEAVSPVSNRSYVLLYRSD
jgi:hypothetical protein